MNDYRQMSIKYLQLNKRRSLVTVLGVAIAVAVLYAILNMGLCRLLQQRRQLREEMDYEIVFLTETEEQIRGITADQRVKSSSVGKYFYWDYYEPKTYRNALYVNTDNPYRMEKILAELENTYQVEGILNTALAQTYLQGGEGNIVFILIVFVLLVSFIFAILGVGIIRNAIQMCLMEQLEDFGNLRCIGSTRAQMKMVVYIQGAVLELAGTGLGVIGGYILCLALNLFLKWEIRFRLLPLMLILIVFLGDLYFAMEENCKVLTNMTPVSAIRGEYRIRKEKIKLRKSSIFGKLFGIEGEYAYKSLMRNPGRFHRTVWCFGMGMAAFMAVMGAMATANHYMETAKKRSGYYSVHSACELAIGDSYEEIQEFLPSTGEVQAIAHIPEVTEAKRLYFSDVLLRDGEANYAHYTEDYMTQTIMGDFFRESLKYNDVGYAGLDSVTCYGYDEADFGRLREALSSGTLDISENGIVLVNGGNTYAADESIKGDELGYVDVPYTDYKVGDTVDLVDMKAFRLLYGEKISPIKQEHQRKMEEYSRALVRVEPESEEEERIKKERDEQAAAYLKEEENILSQCKKQLLDEGKFTTYTIEGIVDRDVNFCDEWSGVMAFVLPLNSYFKLTDTDESMVNGIGYHFSRFDMEEFTEAVSEAGGMADFWTINPYPEMEDTLWSYKLIGGGILLFVCFVVAMTAFNIINTTASSIHLRRKEFAQLRVLGISKEGLIKMVMLEGVISTLTANLIGIVLGTILSFAAYGFEIHLLFGARMHFPFLGAAAGIVISTLILCGSVYMPLRTIVQNMAADLATGGD